jgi:hypothetical protein
VKVTNHGSRAIMDLAFVRLSVDGHDLDELRPTTGPFPLFPTPGNFSLFTFDPATYGSTHPYFIAIRGGPNGEAATLTGNTKITATVRWTDVRAKRWERQGSGPWLTAGPGFGVGAQLGDPVRIRT